MRPERPASGAPDLLWCVGMEGSASTWLFNAVVLVAGALWPDRALITRFVNR